MSRTFTFGITCACVLFFSFVIALSMGVFDGRKVASEGEKDVVTFWIPILLGAPDEKVFLDVTKEYNRKHPDVFVDTIPIPYNSYIGKINVAIATGQPPDVCFNAFMLMDGLRSKQKIPDLAVPVPPDMITPEEHRRYGDACLGGLSRNGVLYAFPRTNVLRGGVYRGNREWFDKAGIDIDYYLEHGWDYDTFRDAMKRVQAVMRKDKGPDACAFGLNLLISDSQFYYGFLPNVVGKDVMQRGFLLWDEKRERYVLDPAVTSDALAEPLTLMQQLIHEDGTWGRKTLGMTYGQLEEDLYTKGLIAAIWADTPGSSVAAQIKCMNEYHDGLRSKPIRMTNVPIPTPRKGMPMVFGMMSEGYGVLKQIPDKGDAHTRRALEFAKYIGSSYVNARLFEARPERWNPWADEDAVHAELRTVQDPVMLDPGLRKTWAQYLDWMKSPNTYISDVKTPCRTDFDVLRGRIETYQLYENGHQILEAVIYKRKEPKTAAEEILKGINDVIEDYYRKNPPGKSR